MTIKQTRREQALLGLLLDIAACFHRLRAIGQEIGGVSAWGGGRWGLMHSLHRDGPQTVPELAKSRPVARQRIQKLVDELRGEGLITLKANPRHKRSKLVALTAKGRDLYGCITPEITDLLGAATKGLAMKDIEAARLVLGQLRQNLTLSIEDDIDN